MFFRKSVIVVMMKKYYFVAVLISLFLCSTMVEKTVFANTNSVISVEGLSQRKLPMNVKVISGEKKNILTNAMLGWRVDESDNIIKDSKPNRGYENTVFIIEHNYDLNNAGINSRPSIQIPKGCVLIFQGGSIKNGRVDFHGASFDILGNYNAFHNAIIDDPGVSIVHPEWFYDDCRNHLEIALQRINDNYRNIIRHIYGNIASSTAIVVALDGNYKISNPVTINKPVKLFGNSSNNISIDSQISSIMIPDDLNPAISVVGNRYFECDGVQFCSEKGLRAYTSNGVNNVLFSITATGSLTVNLEQCSFRGIHQVLNATPIDKGQKEIWIGGNWKISNNTFLLCHEGIIVNNINKGLKYTVANMDISNNTFDCSNYAINIKGAFGVLDIHHNTFESTSGICRSYVEGANVPCYVLYKYNYIEHHKGGDKTYLLEVKNAQLADIRTNLIMSSKYVFEILLTKVKKYYNVDNGDYLKVVKM